MKKLPVVIHKGFFTAISDGETVAIYNRKNMSISRLENVVDPNSTQSIELALSTFDNTFECLDMPKVPLVSSAFTPLIVKGRTSRLHRLTINIANACNLWCSYCYADHGTYHSPTSLMSEEMAVKIVANCLKFYSEIKTIHFFGGEPMLNPKAIKSVCEFIHDERGLKKTEFVATTNGTIYNDDLGKLLKKYSIGLTISLDGPSVIHDKLRPMNNNQSSHSVIRKNIEKLRDLGIEIDFECTYTLEHYKAGISVVDLLEYFNDELNVSQPHIGWSYLPRPKLSSDAYQKEAGIFRKDIETQVHQHLPVELVAKLFGEAARKSIENVISGKGAALTFVIGILKLLAERKAAKGYCPAFSSQLSIAANGNVYPCFMFIGDPSMRMGNIFDESFPGKEAYMVWDRYKDEFGEKATGSDAWYAGLIAGCIAGDYIATGNLNERIYEPVQEALIREVILGLARHIEIDSEINL
jgi:radical SAM protein with 4Fe4S-binding SPASM domain